MRYHHNNDNQNYNFNVNQQELNQSKGIVAMATIGLIVVMSINVLLGVGGSNFTEEQTDTKIVQAPHLLQK